MKIKTILALSILAILLIALVIYLQFTPEQENIIKIGYNTESVNHGPIMVAYEAGIFDKLEINAELVPLKSGKEIQQALAMGRIDIGSAGSTNFFIPISKGAPVKLIAPLTVSPSQVFVRPDDSIKTINDLSGKIIASRLGSSSNLALGYALVKEKISFDSIEFLDIDKSIRPIALMEKKVVDASVAGEYEESIYLDYGAVLLEEWVTKGYTDKLFPRTVIAVNTDYMAKNKETVELFIDSLIASHKYIENSPEESAMIIAQHIDEGSSGAVKFSSQDIIDSWKGVKYILWYEPEDFVEISKMEVEIGDIESDLSLDQIFDLSFEEKLKKYHEEIYASY